MIQRYTCVPVTEYDVHVITNGSVEQVEEALDKINSQAENEIPLTAPITYFETFEEMTRFLDMDERPDAAQFRGKTVFMFFNGVDYILAFLSQVLDHSRKHGSGPRVAAQKKCRAPTNTYFYFDHTVLPSLLQDDQGQWMTMVLIASDILKKLGSVVGRIRGLFLDDQAMPGDRTYAILALLRNFPTVERVGLLSETPVALNGLAY